MVYSDRIANRIASYTDSNLIPYQQKQKIRKYGLYALVVVTCLVFMFPVYWMVVASVQPYDSIIRNPTWFPIDVVSLLTIESYVNVFVNRNFERWYLNSIVVAIISILVTVAASTLAGYGLTRVQFRGRKMFARLILFSYMFPPILLAFPQYQIWRQIGWLNTYQGIAIAHIALSLPFGMWMMWKFFQTVPVSLEESAQMAGASRFRAFYEVALPMAKPGMVAVAVFSYAVAWNEFTMPSILLVNNESWVLTIGLFSFTMQNQVLWSQLMAASTLTVIPSFIFVYFLQKYLLRGFRAGGIG